MTKIYIAGKISGLPLDKAKENFKKGCRYIENLGGIPVNPFDSELPDEAPYEQHIAADLAMMLKCDGVGVLPNWTESRGAINEVKVAIEKSIPVIAIPIELN